MSADRTLGVICGYIIGGWIGTMLGIYLAGVTEGWGWNWLWD